MYVKKDIYCEMCGEKIPNKIDKKNYLYKKVIKTSDGKHKTIYCCSNKCFNKFLAFNK